MIVVLALILVALGTVVFHFVSPWWWTPIASNWGYIDDTILITFWVTGVGTAARIPLALFLVHHFELGIDGVWYAIAITTGIKGLTMMAWFSRGHWERLVKDKT